MLLKLHVFFHLIHRKELNSHEIAYHNATHMLQAYLVELCVKI
ncbi:Uncharacterised protein [Mycobacteroides abscessus subsp. massiliense]|nr:Uncharacterised protein [Mycobacteroides abscessus subsp. massiliense]